MRACIFAPIIAIQYSMSNKKEKKNNENSVNDFQVLNSIFDKEIVKLSQFKIY